MLNHGYGDQFLVADYESIIKINIIDTTSLRNVEYSDSKCSHNISNSDSNDQGNESKYIFAIAKQVKFAASLEGHRYFSFFSISIREMICAKEIRNRFNSTNVLNCKLYKSFHLQNGKSNISQESVYNIIFLTKATTGRT